jgi:hypothetical protein
MFGFSLTGVVIALAAVSAVLIFLVIDARKPKRVEKWEKAAIVKQLLDLSEQEEGLKLQSSAPRPRTPATTPAKSSRPNPSMKRPASKPSLTAQPKVR